MIKPYVFDQDRKEYLNKAWREMEITQRLRQELISNAQAILKKKLIYENVERDTRCPWWLIALIDLREGGVEHLGKRHLHNGDSLQFYTRHVPEGRPHVGHGPPFTWRESAIDALNFDGLANLDKNIWTIEYALHRMEPYNGLSYCHAERPSPYIWSGTTFYDPPTGPGGKVIEDGGPIINSVIDKQCGCAPQLKVLAILDPTLKFTSEFDLEPIPPPKSIPAAPHISTLERPWWQWIIDKFK